MSMIQVNSGLCKSCGLCIPVCPSRLLARGTAANKNGYLTIVQQNAKRCTACRLCAVMCPDSAISVFKD